MNFSPHRLLFITGVLVVIMPHSGFTPIWKEIFGFAMGAYIIFLSFSKKGPRRASGKPWVLRREKAFVENSPITGGKRRVIRRIRPNIGETFNLNHAERKCN